MSGLVVTQGAFRLFRKRVGMTQTQFAAELGVNQSTIVRYENGDLPVPPRVSRQLIALAKIWKVDPPKTRGKLRGGKKAVSL